MQNKKIMETIFRIKNVTLFFLVFSVFFCSVKPRLELEPESLEFYQKAHLLFTKFEKKKFNVLTSLEERKKFIQNFWEVRNPNPYSDDNEYKEEINRRFDFVNRYYREGSKPGWDTDRGRIYMQFGEPDYIQRKLDYVERYENDLQVNSYMNDPSIHDYVYWYFGNYAYQNTESRGDGFGILFIDRTGHGRYRIDMRGTSIRLLEATKKIKYLHLKKKEAQSNFKNVFFSVVYEKEAEILKIMIKPKNLTFHSKSDNMIAKLKINLVIHSKKKTFKHSEIKQIIVNKEALLKDNFRLLIKIPLKISNKNSSLDIFVFDMLGDTGSRKFIKKIY